MELMGPWSSWGPWALVSLWRFGPWPRGPKSRNPHGNIYFLPVSGGPSPETPMETIILSLCPCGCLAHGLAGPSSETPMETIIFFPVPLCMMHYPGATHASVSQADKCKKGSRRLNLITQAKSYGRLSPTLLVSVGPTRRPCPPPAAASRCAVTTVFDVLLLLPNTVVTLAICAK